MKIRIRTAEFALAILALGSVAPRAYADAFSFSFATDPVGCASTGNCSGVVDASGTFTTAALGATPGFAGTQTYAITSITGEMNGGAMTLLAGNTGAVWQPNPGQAVYGLFPFFPVQFSANGTQWNLIPDSLFPPGTDSLLTSASGTFNDVSLTITPMSVPEPSTLAFIALTLLGFVGISRFRAQVR